MERRVKIKICGLRREADIDCVNELEPDYVGFVFANRKREISEETAEYLGSLLKPRIQKVGVFVDAPIERVIGMLNSGIIDLAQLHGNEDASYVQKIRQTCHKPVIKAMILGHTKKDGSREEVAGADYLLFDSGKGSGKRLDLDSLLQAQNRMGVADRPFFLAGGLSPDNITEVLTLMGDRLPYAVDVSSGVETDGYKDSAKVRAFVERVRGYY